MTKTINVMEAQQDLQKLVEFAEAGNGVTIAKGSIPVARLTALRPVTARKKRVAGLHKGVAWVSEDFDEPPSDAFWLGSQ